MIHEAIEEENKLCATEEELATALKTRIKQWILVEKPSPFEVSGPWKVYIKTITDGASDGIKLELGAT